MGIEYSPSLLSNLHRHEPVLSGPRQSVRPKITWTKQDFIQKHTHCGAKLNRNEKAIIRNKQKMAKKSGTATALAFTNCLKRILQVFKDNSMLRFPLFNLYKIPWYCQDFQENFRCTVFKWPPCTLFQTPKILACWYGAQETFQ